MIYQIIISRYVYMKRIILSLAMIAFVGVAAIGATGAFFSDSETSTGNTFAAGDIDLKVSNTSYVTDATGTLVASTATTWAWNELTGKLFFNFADVKPGDHGEDTIGLKVSSNDSWLCAAVTVKENDDVTCNDSELGVDTTCVEPDTDMTDGDLAQSLSFMWWADDGDNVLESDETVITQGKLGDAPLNTPINIALADSNRNIWTTTGPVAGNTERYIGKGWCFGTMTSAPVSQDGVATSGPLARGSTGFTCDGASTTNAAQTDSTKLDVAFMAVQSRNNSSFVCEGVPAAGPIAIETNVGASNLASSFVDVASDPTKWFFYNDENDTINSGLGSFVAGPTTPMTGTGSAQMTVSGTERKNIATYQFKDIKLADIDAMSFTTLSQSVGNPGSTQRAPYLHFNVDFNNSDTWQRRLVFVPSANGTVVPDTWQTWNTGGTSMWSWSGFAANGNMWPDGNTNANRTWNDIVATWPNAETRSTDSWLGIRVGEPYADGFTGNVDSFSMTVNGVTKKFDFEN
jgi:predicted ribosomally synthesized peptide with SipW-like signal peptide